jgi:hypothetical protein
MIFRNLSWNDCSDLLIYGTVFGLIIVWEFLFVLMFFFEKVNVLEPNLFVRVVEMVLLAVVFVLVWRKFWGDVNANKE